MSAKTRANAMFARMTGHHLVKGHPGVLQQQLADARHDLRRARRKLAKRQGAKATSAAAPGTGFPSDYDAAAGDIIRAVRPFTMTNNDKLFGLIQATRYIVRNKIEGDIVEC
ncbi:MAG TPA: hypothetical protein VE441_12065, partial [Mycobacterium sp.]|nr:hypothetical protein [Mycobacterium sp.]